MKEIYLTKYRNFKKDFGADIKLFLFILFTLCFYRGLFIWCLRADLAQGTTLFAVFDIMASGFIMSLKTAVFCASFSFFAATITHWFYAAWHSAKIRFYIGAVWVFIISILFQARVPYYLEFHNTFDAFIFNTFKDDAFAIADTAIKQYNAPLRLAAGLICAGLFIYALKKFLNIDLSRFKYKKLTIAAAAFVLLLCGVYLKNGGALIYNEQTYWHNKTFTGQHLLQAALPDDLSAIYKAYGIHNTIASAIKVNVPDADIEAAAKKLTGRDYSVQDYTNVLKRYAEGSPIKKPRHIFVIVGETYMLWPMLKEYENLGIAKGIKQIAESRDAYFTKAFLSAAKGTVFSIIGAVTGLPEVAAGLSYRALVKDVQKITLPAQLKRLGYETRFYYGGNDDWENLGYFTTLYGFDKTYFKKALPKASGNLWGVDDKVLFEGVAKLFNPDVPSFNFILTVSNHPPYTVDLAAESDIKTAADFSKILPQDKQSAAFIKKLRHFEYSDKYAADFIKQMSARYPDSIFIFTGDHAQRWFFTANPTMQEEYGVPFIIYGGGIKKAMFPPDASGSHKDILATIMELVAPKGFEYYTLGGNILKGGVLGMHEEYWVKDGIICKAGTDKCMALPGAKVPPAAEIKDTNELYSAEQTIARRYVFSDKIAQ